MIAVPALVCVFSAGAVYAQDPPDLIFSDGFELLGPGDACVADERCASGSCVDGVCCNTSCEGVCTACDVAAAPGTCSPIPAGSDPDDECGAVSCSAYYWGWSGDTCYRKADVSAAQAACGTGGACRTTAQECSAQATPGAASATCHSFCQDPNPGTCTGTTPGQCVNVSQGSASCGSGVCQVTAPVCLNGAPNTCVPNWGAASAETCNDIDDNCDGTPDNGAFADAYEPNVDCGSPRTLNTVGSDQSQSYSTMTIYAAGDVDYYRFTASETDSSCACGITLDEDYEVRVTLTVPVGGGSYQVCAGTACGVWQSCVIVAAGTSGTASFFLDGECGLTPDSYPIYVRVVGWGAPAYECRPYTLSYTFDAGLCR